MPRVGNHPVVGQEQEGFGKLPAAHLDGAELEVEVHHLVDIVVDVLKRLHQVDQRVVAEAGLLLGLSYPRVELYGAVGRKLVYEREDLVYGGGEFAHQDIAHHDGTGVDERVPGIPLSYSS